MDRRTSKTKTLIKEALLELLENKELVKISITDIAKKVDINRSTFYLHYNSIDDVIFELEDEVIDEIYLICKEYNFEPVTMALNIAYYVKSAANIIKPILNSVSAHFYSRLANRVRPFIEASFNASFPYNVEENKFILRFIFSGSFGAFKLWLDDDCKTNPRRIVLHFIKAFNEINNLNK